MFRFILLILLVALRTVHFWHLIIYDHHISMIRFFLKGSDGIGAIDMSSL